MFIIRISKIGFISRPVFHCIRITGHIKGKRGGHYNFSIRLTFWRQFLQSHVLCPKGLKAWGRLSSHGYGQVKVGQGHTSNIASLSPLSGDLASSYTVSIILFPSISMSQQSLGQFPCSFSIPQAPVTHRCSVQVWHPHQSGGGPCVLIAVGLQGLGSAQLQPPFWHIEVATETACLDSTGTFEPVIFRGLDPEQGQGLNLCWP